MKTAYELAMERLNQSAPIRKLNDEQKRRLAELDRVYAARIAEREIAGQSQIDQAQGTGEFEQADKLRAQLAAERQQLQAELEEKKDRVRAETPPAAS